MASSSLALVQQYTFDVDVKILEIYHSSFFKYCKQIVHICWLQQDQLFSPIFIIVFMYQNRYEDNNWLWVVSDVVPIFEANISKGMEIVFADGCSSTNCLNADKSSSITWSCFTAFWWMPRFPSRKREAVYRKREVSLGICLSTASPSTWTRVNGRKWMEWRKM